MLHKIFTVYDSKIEAYLTPFFMQHRGAAIRAFTDLVNDPKSNINKYPSDFTLFEMGEYDDSSAQITTSHSMISLGVGTEYLKVE